MTLLASRAPAGVLFLGCQTVRDCIRDDILKLHQHTFITPAQRVTKMKFEIQRSKVMTRANVTLLVAAY